MIKTVFKNGIIYTISNFLSKGINILLIPIYTSLLSPADYGAFDYIVLFGTLLNFVVTLELKQGLIRFTPSITWGIKRKLFFSSATNTIILLYLLAIGLTYLFKSPLSNLILDDSSQGNLLVLGIVMLFSSEMTNLSFLTYQLQSKSIPLSILSIVFAIATSGSCIVLVKFADMGVLGLIIGTIIGNTITVICYAFYSKLQYFCLTISKTILKRLVIYSTPLIPASVGTFMASFIDRIYIKEMESFDDLGHIGVASRFASVIPIVILAFQRSLGPKIFEQFKDPNTPIAIGKMLEIYYVAGLAILGGYVCYSSEVIQFLTAPEYFQASLYLPLMVLNLIIYNAYIFFPGLSIVEKTGQLTIISIISSITNLILNYFLILEYGVVGALISTVISSTLFIIMTMLTSNANYQIPMKQWKFISFLLLSAIVVLFFNQYVVHLTPGLFNMTAKTAVYLVFCFGTSFIFLEKSTLSSIAHQINVRINAFKK